MSADSIFSVYLFTLSGEVNVDSWKLFILDRLGTTIFRSFSMENTNLRFDSLYRSSTGSTPRNEVIHAHMWMW